MRRPRTASRKPPTTRQRKTENPKRNTASNAARRTTSSVADLQERLERQAREIEHAREERAAISEVLRVISSSPGDLQQVFAAMLENAVRICGAKFGNLWLYDGEFFRIRATTYGPRPPMSNIFAARVRSVPMHGSESADSRKQGKRIKLPMWLPNRHMMTSCGLRRSISRAPEPSWVCRCSRMAK